MIKRNKMLIIALFFMLLHPLYLYILNTFKIYQMPLTFISILFLILATIGKFRLKIFKWVLLWFLLVVDMLLNNIGASDLLKYYFIMIFMMYCLVSSYGWEKGAINVLVIMTLPHAIATLIFFIFPNLYNLIKPLLTYQSIFFEGYKTALTGHYTTNSIYISIGFIMIGSFIFNENKNKKKLIFLFIIYIFSLILTTKRGPLIFSISSLFFTYILLDKKRIDKKIIKIIGTGIIVSLFFYLVSEVIPEISEVLKRFSSDGSSGREIMYSLAFSMFKKNIFFGQGTGAYKYEYAISLANDAHHKYLNVHNVYLQLLCENGIVGFFLFIIAAWGTLLSSIKVLRKLGTNEKKERILLSASVSYQIFFLLYCLTENPLYDSMLYIPYFILISIFYSIKRIINRG